MKREEILKNWETGGIYVDWYAVDSYDPIDGTMRRLFVGNEDEAVREMRARCVPSETACSPFFRCSVISASDAKAYFTGIVDKLPSEQSMYSVVEAAGILGVNRQRVNQLLNRGQLEGRKVGGTWMVYRYSVENRLEAKPQGGRPKSN